jgi:LacI family transcriptional regulator
MNSMMNLLIDRGHRKIVCLKSSQGDDRYEIYKSVLESRRIPLDERLIVECAGDQFSAYGSMKEFLCGKNQFTAVFAHNDTSAIGAYYALREVGLRVPEDVSLTGVDDIPECETLIPSLSSITHEPGKLARACLELMTERLSGSRKESAPAQITIKSRLAVRDSITYLSKGKMAGNA